MAKFTPPLAPTNDPNYLGYSQTPSKSDIMAAEDKSGAGLIQSLGNLVGPASNAIYSSINEHIKADLQSGFDKIVGEHGGNLTPDEVIPIAGTGARGAAFSAGVDIGESKSVPPEVSGAIARASKLTEVYRAGGLSNSHWKASMAELAKRVRTDYPGFREEVDAALSSIAGHSAANQVRASLLSDLASASATQNSAVNKLMTTFHSDQKYIQTLFPGLQFDQYASNPQKYDTEVGLLKAHDYKIQAKNLDLESRAKGRTDSTALAKETYTDVANHIVSTIVKGALNTLAQQAVKMRTEGADASKMQEFVNQAGAIRLKVQHALIQAAQKGLPTSQIDSNGNPISSSHSYSTYLDKDTVKGIQDQALSGVDGIIASIQGKDTDLASATSNIIKHQAQLDELHLSENNPTARAMRAVKNMVGDQTMSIVTRMGKGAGLEGLTKAVTDTSWLSIASKEGKPTTATEAANALKKTHTSNLGKAVRVTVQGIQKLAEHKDPEVAFRAVQALYGDKEFFANVDSAQKQQVFAMLASPSFTEKMKALGKDHPEALTVYTNWMEQNFPTVAKRGLDDLQSAVSYNKYDWSFDPKTWSYSASTKPEFRSSLGNDPAPEYVSRINSSIKLMKPVLEAKYGDQALTHLQELMHAAGFNENAPKHGSFFEEFNKKLQSLTGAPLGPSPEPQKKSEVTNQTVIKIADNFLGMDEVHHKDILSSFIQRTTGKKIDPQEQAWCADFANAVLGEAGLGGTGSSSARSFLNYGKPTTTPKRGDVVVLWRGDPKGPYGHVGFFNGFVKHGKEQYVQLLAGNSGNGAVTLGEYPASRVLGYRQLATKDLEKWHLDFSGDKTG